MNRSKKILGLFEQDKEMELSANAQKKLSPSDDEQVIAAKMKAKGYKFSIQFTLDGEDWGKPLYFKTVSEVGPFMRETEGGKLKQKWVVHI